MKNDTREALLRPLFAQALSGDKRAYEKLLNEIAGFARNYVRRRLASPTDHDDVVQEILLSVHKALHTYDPARPCLPWLAAIMHYRLSDWLRKHYSIRAVRTLSADHAGDVFDQIASDEVTADPFAYESLEKAVETLPRGQQAVIQAMYREELTVRETSEKLGMSISAVKVTAHRAYRKLRMRLEGE
ncbi:MAG TPA: RNA polymerase subunit sigma-24 [Alphaproteobacteria bacterium]|jgi:RNA polymerase sigma-70 factor, ECF subfamily|nr:RNA polymerase subunit sigma-24 [Alphaproteobacteria bacterium]